VTVASSNTSGRGLYRTGVLLAAVVGLLLGLLVAVSPAAAVGRGAAGDGKTPTAIQSGDADAAAVAYINAQNTGTVTQVSAGGYHSCAVTTGKTVYCWGDNRFGQLGNGSTTQSLVPVRVCAAGVTDTAGKCGNQFLSGVVQVSTGDFHSCAVTDTGTGGTVYCWGDNRFGQLGNGEEGTFDDKSLVPVRVCAAGVTDTAGKCGNQFLSGVVQVSAGGYHTCAVTDTGTGGTVYCWGWNGSGQLGNGEEGTFDDKSFRPESVVAGEQSDGDVLSGVVQVSAGGYHTCAVRDTGTGGTVFCWGRNDEGQLGNGSTTQSLVPVRVCAAGVIDTAGKCGNQFLSGVVQVSTGDFHSCAVTDTGTGGTVYCWGSNYYGQLGNDQGGTSNDKSLVPVRVCAAGVTDTAGKCGNQFLSGVVQVSAGGYHTCAVRDTGTGGTVFCWGRNDEGQLGIGSSDGPDECERSCSKVPVRVVNNEAQGFQNGQVSGLSAGRYHSCAVTEAGVAYCWGLNGSGRLGDGSTDRNSFVPVAVAGQMRVVPNPVEFAAVDPGSSKSKDVAVKHSFPLTDAAVVVDVGITSKPVGFSFDPRSGCAKSADELTLLNGQACEGAVKFAPEAPGTYGGIVTLTPQKYPNAGTEFATSGYSPGEGPVVKADAVDFGKVNVYTAKVETVKVKNAGDEPLKITGGKITSDPDDEFAADLDDCTDGQVAAGKSCTAKVQFFPRQAGASAALLELKSNAVGSATIALTGMGEAAVIGKPGKVRKLRVPDKTVTAKKATAKWKRPKGDVPVTGYETRIKKKNGNWKKWSSKDPEPNLNGWISRTFKKLSPNTTYKVQVRAVSYEVRGKKSAVGFTTDRKGIPTRPGNG
jgi:alpha-tubulin suppressor-like RCC1 family protein